MNDKEKKVSMTRDEQTIIASEKYSNSLEYDFNLDYETLEWAFQAGAQWADANPCWHKCDEELPEPNVKVLCYTSKGTYFVAWREEQLVGQNQPTGKYKWSRWNCPIIAWTELPEPPKFD